MVLSILILALANAVVIFLVLWAALTIARAFG
jgi:hypothetical protein